MSHYLNILSWPGLGWFGGIKAIKLYGQVASVSYHPELLWMMAHSCSSLHPTLTPTSAQAPPPRLRSQQLRLPSSKAVTGLVQLQEEALLPGNRQTELPRFSWTTGGCVTLAARQTASEASLLFNAHLFLIAGAGGIFILWSKVGLPGALFWDSFIET